MAAKPNVEIRVEVEQIADGVIVRPYGEIDMRRAPQLRTFINEVQRQRPARIVIDLEHVPEMDSSAVATLIEALKNTVRESGLLVLCGLQPRVRALFQIVRLGADVFPMVESVDEAISLPNRRKFGRFCCTSVICDKGEVLDISAGGVRLATRRRMRGEVRVCLSHEQSELSVIGRVIRSKRIRRGLHEVGLQFVGLDARQARRLAAILGVVRENLSRGARLPGLAA